MATSANGMRVSGTGSMTDPFSTLGLTRSATVDEVRRARRELAKSSHPDHGGDADRMQTINAAAADALRLIELDRSSPPERDVRPGAGTAAEHGATPARDRQVADPEGRWFDRPSFTVEALPVEAYEGLLLAAAALGDVVDDEPPYELTVSMGPPIECWCRLDVVPDAGASTVSLAVAPVEGSVPSIEAVRDAWIAELNGLDWSQL